MAPMQGEQEFTAARTSSVNSWKIQGKGAWEPNLRKPHTKPPQNHQKRGKKVSKSGQFLVWFCVVLGGGIDAVLASKPSRITPQNHTKNHTIVSIHKYTSDIDKYIQIYIRI